MTRPRKAQHTKRQRYSVSLTKDEYERIKEMQEFFNRKSFSDFVRWACFLHEGGLIRAQQ